MDRVGHAVSRELGRFGPATGMAPVVDAWPTAVGPEIARNAWPARFARDGTLHVHTTDSIWAFELKSRAEEIRERLGEDAPPKLAFAPGPIPEPPDDPSERTLREPVVPSAQDIAAADALARQIGDEELRRVVAKAAAYSLARASNDRSFW